MNLIVYLPWYLLDQNYIFLQAHPQVVHTTVLSYINIGSSVKEELLLLINMDGTDWRKAWFLYTPLNSICKGIKKKGVKSKTWEGTNIWLNLIPKGLSKQLHVNSIIYTLACNSIGVNDCKVKYVMSTADVFFPTNIIIILHTWRFFAIWLCFGHGWWLKIH